MILACRDAQEVRRAGWTAALSAWCEQQPDLVAFTGRCLIHRAELMPRRCLTDALEAADRARTDASRARTAVRRARRASAGEVHR
ncbi:MAG: hypothetical protein R2718_09925 [Solirubrobacterales bacterium]